MKYYLSSYKLGNKTKQLKKLLDLTSQKRIAIIPNAADFTGADPERNRSSIQENSSHLLQLGASPEVLDLKKYFNHKNQLKKDIQKFDGVYVTGGNTFVLRQAMKISGFDEIILSLKNTNFLYIAYSAGVCVLCPSLKPYAIVDDPNDHPYHQIDHTIWEGLDILPFAFQPHYTSNHPESDKVHEEVKYCIENKILFKAYKDGEVLIIE